MKNAENTKKISTCLKVAQHFFLIAFGITISIFALILLNSRNPDYIPLSYTIAASLILFGVISMISGFFNRKSALNSHVISGVILLSFGVAFAFNADLVKDLLPILITTVCYAFSVILIAHAVDKFTGLFAPKNVKHGIWQVLISALLLAAATTYIFFINNDKLFNYVLAICGLILVILGIFNIVCIYKELKREKEEKREEEIRKKQEEQRKKETTEIRVAKIIDIEELRKNKGKKIHHSESYGKEGTDIKPEKVEEEPKKSVKKKGIN